MLLRKLESPHGLKAQISDGARSVAWLPRGAYIVPFYTVSPSQAEALLHVLLVLTLTPRFSPTASHIRVL